MNRCSPEQDPLKAARKRAMGPAIRIPAEKKLPALRHFPAGELYDMSVMKGMVEKVGDDAWWLHHVIGPWDMAAEVRGLVSGTFHSVANGILRAEAALLDYPRDYTILDAEDASTLMGACIAEIGAEGTPLPAAKDLPKPGVLAHLHSLARNTGAIVMV